MKKKRALAASRIPDDYAVDPPGGRMYAIRESGLQPNSIIMNAGDNNEMLRITRDAFYVRGVRVPQDEKEAEVVYNAFKEFLVYNALTKEY